MFIVVLMLVSAIIAAYESIQKLLHPQPLSNIGWVMAAAVIGFLGNEAVAQLRIRVGRGIGSAALIADGQHARVDGFTSRLRHEYMWHLVDTVVAMATHWAWRPSLAVWYWGIPPSNEPI